MPKVQPVDQISVNDLLGFNSDAQVINDELAGADSGYQGLRVDSILSQDTSLKEAETDVFVDDWSCFMNHKNGRSISNTEPEDPFENCAVAGNAHVSPQNKKKAPDEFFDDLLGSQGFTSFVSKKHIPRTMAEMKRSGIEREMDPTQLKVYDWKTGKERNIRALLCSLHTIVWSDAKWTEVGMHQLIGVSDVKKIYRKACLAVHPDKLSGTDKEELAKAIFMELNDAWSEFEKKQGLA